VNRRERLQAVVSGQVPDRVPVSAWGHFYVREVGAAALADVMVEFFERHDWDFLKVHARASYHVEGWGFAYEPSVDPAKLHVCTHHPIATSADWAKLEPLPLTCPPLAEQFDALARIRSRIAADVPLIMTVFSPLDVAEKLVDRDAALLKRHVEENPDALEKAMQAFAETFAAFVRRLPALGVDGIFFSTKWANNLKLTPEQYRRLVRPYDLAVLAEAKGMWCNILHLCEDHVQLAAMADYPVQVMHWDAHAGHNPSYGEGQRQSGKAIGGGVDAKTLAQGTPADVLHKAVAAIEETGGRGFLLGPGCSVQVAATPDDNLRALRRASDTARGR
jgi:uroporphyrinogen decarboxylase